VVAAEGAQPAGGATGFIEGTRRYGGLAEHLVAEIEEACGKETRTLVLGHIQRGGSPNAYDRNLSLRCGVAAVRAVERGNFGCMVGLQGKAVRAVPLGDAVQQGKQVTVDSDIVTTGRRLGISFGDGSCSTRTRRRASAAATPVRPSEVGRIPGVYWPRLVVITITPFAPRMPYIEVSDGSLRTWMCDTSPGLIPARAPVNPYWLTGIPSITKRGSLLPMIELVPRTRTE
jgi:hypothetical protein